MANRVKPAPRRRARAPSIPRDGVLEEMTVQQVRAMRPQVVVLPLGSTEPHGPHLPYGTDTYEINAVARPAVAAANRRGARVLLYPTLPITNNANMRKLPFACRIAIGTLMRMLIDIAAQCQEDGIRKLVIVNGHGGNPPALLAALREIAGMDHMPFVCLAQTGKLKPDGYIDPIEHPSDHAGESEASRMLHIRPDLVHKDQFTNFSIGKLKVKALAKVDFVRPWHLYMPHSAGGETRQSTAEKGRIIIESDAAALADLLVELSAARWDERFPYE